MSLPIGTELETQKLKLELRLKQLERVETCHDEFMPWALVRTWRAVVVI